MQCHGNLNSRKMSHLPRQTLSLEDIAVDTLVHSSCGTVVRLVHHTHLSGQLARNTTLRHVLDQLAAYGSNAANGDYYYVKVATDIQSDDAASTKVDMDNAANAWHSADGHLAMVASYIGKF